jgi:hypothetical protein
MVSEIMGSGREVSKNTSLIWQISFNGQRCDLQIHHCFLYNVFVCGVNAIKYKIEEKHYYKYNNFIEIYIHTKYKLFNEKK